MQILKTIWDIFQTQILGMKWLNDLIGSMLSAFGLDTSNRWVGSIQFFIYDVIKIVVLIMRLNLYYQLHSKLLPAGTQQENIRAVSRYRSKFGCCSAWYGNALLLLLVHSFIHWFYFRRSATRSHFFVFDFLTNG
jgi:hypothetical protein